VYVFFLPSLSLIIAQERRPAALALPTAATYPVAKVEVTTKGRAPAQMSVIINFDALISASPVLLLGGVSSE